MSIKKFYELGKFAKASESSICMKKFQKHGHA